MLFFLIFVLISSPLVSDQLEETLKNMQEGYNKANVETFNLALSEKGKEKWDKNMLMSFFLNANIGWGNIQSFKLPPKEVEKNVFEIETKFEKARLTLRLNLSNDKKVDDFSFIPIKKVDFENPKISSKKLKFPFKGNWIVKEGGGNLEKNLFKDTYDKAFALYFQKTDEKGSIIDSKNFEVLAPVEANIWQIIDNIPENEKNSPNKMRPNGNVIVLKLSGEEFLAITNLKEGSFKFKAGQNVKVGDVLALTGFSGDINEPMVGMWVQTNVLEQEGEGVKFYFSCIEKFDGKKWIKKEDYFPEKGDILRSCSN